MERKKKKEKLAYRYFFSTSDEESRSVRKRMWKTTCGVFFVFFLSTLMISCFKNSAKKAVQ